MMATFGNPGRYLFIGILFQLLVACVAIPAQEMSDARQAIQAAREVGAEIFAREELANAERLMQQAEQDLSNGFFGNAQNSAAAAKRQAMRARDKAMAASAE